MRRLGSRSFVLALSLVLATAFSAALSGNAWSQSPSSLPHRSLTTVVRSYFATLNADLRSGDMSSLGEIYAANATVTIISLHGDAHAYRGLAQITKFWKQMAKSHGLRYYEDRLLLLDTVHAAAYEHASTARVSLAGR